MPFSVPDAPSELFEQETYLDTLLAIKVTEETTVTTKFGQNPAIKGDVTVCDGPDTGLVVADATLFGAIVGQLRNHVGQTVLGRLHKIPLKNGNGKWALADPTPEDVTAATAIMPNI